MVVVAIVLGMLVANMFKEVCGCKNLIEGQPTLQDGCIVSTGSSQLPTSGGLSEGMPCPNNAACPNAVAVGYNLEDCPQDLMEDIGNCDSCKNDGYFARGDVRGAVPQPLCAACCQVGAPSSESGGDGMQSCPQPPPRMASNFGCLGAVPSGVCTADSDTLRLNKLHYTIAQGAGCDNCRTRGRQSTLAQRWNQLRRLEDDLPDRQVNQPTVGDIRSVQQGCAQCCKTSQDQQR